jgi:hypothetical protein
MILYKASIPAILLAVTMSSRSYAQYAAPSSIAPALIQYTSSNNPGYPNTRLILYSSDQTYMEISLISRSPLGTSTQAPHSGTYLYSIDPQNSSHATIVYDGGSGSPATDNLYFTATDFGLQTPPVPVSAGAGPPTFTWAPKQVTNGGVNLSNRSQLNSGGIAISGFVVSSASPRWVLLRAVGTSLSNFGVSGFVATPSLTLYDSTQTIIGASSVWSADPNLTGGYSAMFSLTGAFPLANASNEGVLLVQLNPGAYTGVFSAATAGTILCEVYFLPY